MRGRMKSRPGVRASIRGGRAMAEIVASVAVALSTVAVGPPSALAEPRAASSGAHVAPLAPAASSRFATPVRRGSGVLSQERPGPLRPNAPPRLRRPTSTSLARGTARSTSAPQVLAAAPPPALASRAPAPAVVQPGFGGVAESTTDPLEPPDPWVAVGPDHVVQAVNDVVRISSRTGDVLDERPLGWFFGLDSPGLPTMWNGDPRFVFDAAHGRWIASEYSYDCTPGTYDPGHIPSATHGHGYIDLSVSWTADPLGGWTAWTFPYADAFPDFPSLGTATDKIGQGATLYGMKAPDGAGADDCIDDSAFGGRDVVVYDWAPILSGTAFQVWEEKLATGFAPRVVTQTPATSSTLFVVEESLASGAVGNVRYEAIGGRVGDGSIARAAGVDLTAAGVVAGFSATPPPAPRQPGGTIANAVDERPTDAIWEGGRLAFVSTYPCSVDADATTDDCVRVSELSTPSSPTSTPTRRQDFLVGDSGRDSYMGGIGLTRDGTLHVVWTSSSSSTPPVLSAAYQRAGTSGSLSDTASVKASGVAYSGQRWGDYVGVAQDPQVPDAVWQANQYVASDGSWATWVSQLQTGGLRYVPITPTRLVDTRTGLGIGSKLVAGTPRTFAVTGKAGVPAAAKAVTGNVTVVGQTAGGFVSVTPTATSTPATSTINVPAADIRANNLTATLGPTGTLSAVFRAASGQTTNLVVDVTGYYVDDASKAGLTPVTPTRFLDSRTGLGSTGSFGGNAPRFVQLSGRTVSGVAIPGTATAVTANVTVTNQTRGGYLTVMPTSPGSTAPPTSTLNFPVKDNRANGVTVPLGASGANAGVWIVYRPAGGTSADHADVLLDVTGYFTNGSGAQFHPLNPGRIMDTRPGAILSGSSEPFYSGEPAALATAGHWGVPTGAVAVAGNVTVTNQSQHGYVSVTRDAPPGIPTTSTINFPKGDNRANGVTTAIGSGGSLWFDYQGPFPGTSTDLILDLSGYFR